MDGEGFGASVTEDEQRLIVRLVLASTWALLLSVGLFGPSRDGSGVDFALLGGVVAMAGRYLPLRRRGGAYDVRVAPGIVRISGFLPRTVRSKDVLGATSFDAADGTTEVLLALKRSGTMSFRAARTDAHRLLRALDVPAAGKGEVDLTLAPRLLDWIELTLRLVLAMMFALPVLVRIDSVLAFLALPSFFGTIAAIIVAFANRMLARAILAISPRTVSVRTSDERESLTRADLEAVELAEGELVFQRAGHRPLRVAFRRRYGVGLDGALAERLAKGLPRADVAREAGALARGGRDLHTWLARLEQLGATSDVYRGEGLSDAELWALLESADYEPDLRAAAGRVLSKRAPDELRVRIAPVLDTIGDPAVRKRVETVVFSPLDAIEDDDEAPAVVSRRVR